MGQPLDNVFRIISEVNRQPVDSPVVQVIREGSTIKLTSASLLVAKDGTERPLIDTAAPIKNNEGQFVGVVVRLPIIVEAPLPLPPEPTENETPITTARRILVVDDNRDSATSLAMLLKLTGHETNTAYDGLEAVEAAATCKPDVILLDIGLPKLNGYEACRRIREQPWGKKVVIIALT